MINIKVKIDIFFSYNFWGFNVCNNLLYKFILNSLGNNGKIPAMASILIPMIFFIDYFNYGFNKNK